MEDQAKQSGVSNAVEKGAHTAQAVRGAVKAGKAIAGAAKGAASGPYGVAAMALWENRKTVFKVLAVTGCVLLLPILFMLMLPSIIFGGFGGENAEIPIMNDYQAVMDNITEGDSIIRTTMRGSYYKVMGDIQADSKSVGSDIEVKIVNPYEKELMYNGLLVLSQYCVAQEDYETINLNHLKDEVNKGKEHLFSYEKTTTETSVVYTVNYGGESYFGDKLFGLNDDEKKAAQDYADNLRLFLGDKHFVDADFMQDSESNMFSGLPYTGVGNEDIVAVALSQLGNPGGYPYWSWYGFGGRVEWCACFVSWCANQLGFIDAGIIPKFAGCTSGGMAWFKANNQWQENDYIPTPGTIIFFDWASNGLDGDADHVGIVEKVEDGRICTVEGNSNDMVRQNSYPIGYYEIRGYGVPLYTEKP